MDQPRAILARFNHPELADKAVAVAIEDRPERGVVPERGERRTRVMEETRVDAFERDPQSLGTPGKIDVRPVRRLLVSRVVSTETVPIRARHAEAPALEVADAKFGSPRVSTHDARPDALR